MAKLTTRARNAIVGTGLVIALVAGYCYCAIRPAVHAKNALKVAAATQVGRTTAQQIKESAKSYGLQVDEGAGYLAIGQRNHLLEYLHLAPQTLVIINAQVTADVITLLSVRAWVGEREKVADIDIREFETHNTGCGDVPECIKPYSSTMLTSVFFAPSTPIARRAHLLSLNFWCLARIGGCKNSREFLPSAWENVHQ